MTHTADAPAALVSVSTRPRNARRDIAILCITCIALLAPFLGKPIHIDDPMYIWTAQQIVNHPLDFYGFQVNWEGHLQPMPEVMINPPLLPVYLAVVGKLFGWSEIALHAGILPLAVLCVAGVYLLAGYFCRAPFWAALLMLLCPAFLVSATTLMCEVPVLCLWIWALLLWIRGSTRSTGWLPLAGLLIGMAILTKYSAVNLLPLVVGHSVIYPARFRTRIVQAISLVIPVAIMLAYNHYTFVRYGHALLSDATTFSADFAQQHRATLAMKLLDTLTFIGGGGLAVALVGFIAMSRPVRLSALAMIPVMALIAKGLLSLPHGWIVSWPFYAQAGFLAAAGVGCAATCIGAAWKSTGHEFRNRLFLLLWIGGVFVFAARFNWAINARSILPLIPPVCIMTQCAIDRRPAKRRGLYVLAGLAGGIVCILAMCVDYDCAAANRWAAIELTREYKGTKIWFLGHWGFQYYMQAQGGLPLDENSPACKPGDIVLIPVNNYYLPPHGVRMLPIHTLTAEDTYCMTLLNNSMGAGFYFSPGDRLPFIFGFVPPERYVVFRVRG